MKVPKKEKKNHIHKNGSNTSYSKYSVMSKRLEDISNNPHKIFPVSNDVFFFFNILCYCQLFIYQFIWLTKLEKGFKSTPLL